ncbi:MAG: hypothetical protein NVSMB6_20550 [Burkholderiaceae bacterium]
MNFVELFLILRARYRVILLTLLLSVVTTVATSLLMPKTYMATTSLVLNYKGVDPVTGQGLPAHLMPGYTATQVDIINSARIALQVVDNLRLAERNDFKKRFADEADGKGTLRDWLASALLKKLKVIPARESSVLDITFRNGDPAFAAAVANAVASAYQQVSIQLKTEPSQTAARYFEDQTKLLRETLEKAQNRLSSYQQANGIVNADSRLDVESARLNELSSQLVNVHGQAIEAASRQRQARSAGGASPDILANPLIQALKASLSVAEAKFAQIAQKMEKNHPQYQAAKSEVDQLRATVKEQIRLAGMGVAGNARILHEREGEIRSALVAQTGKVMQMNSARDKLKVLANEVESAQKAYESAAQRYTQTRMEGQSNQTDIAILSPATVPTLPAAPRLIPNVLMSIVLGSLLGLGFGLLAEGLDRRVRSVHDLARVLQVPVLGTVAWESDARQRLSASPAPARLGVSSN